MISILSVSAKNNFIKNATFIPVVDFRLFTFGFDSDSLDGNGFQRKNIDLTEKNEDTETIVEAPLPSSLHLDDILIPKSDSFLEKILYSGGRKEIFPQGIIPYLFFGRFHPSAISAHHLNPKYLFYSHFIPQKSLRHLRGYSTIGSENGYFTESPYVPIDSSREYSHETAYPLVYLALLSHFVPQNDIYTKANLSSLLKSSTVFAYETYSESAPVYAKATINVQAKPFELVEPVQLSTVYSLLPQQRPKINMRTDEIPNAIYLSINVRSIYRLQLNTKNQIYDSQHCSFIPSSQTNLQQQKPKINTDEIPRLNFSQETKSITQSLATLETNVRSVYLLQGRTMHQIYASNHNSPLHSAPNNSQQKTQTWSKLEMRVRAFLSDKTYKKPETGAEYVQNQRYIQIPSQNVVEPKQVPYIKVEYLQQNLLLKIDGSITRNYDVQPQWINVMGSKFWEGSPAYIGTAIYSESQSKAKPYIKKIKYKIDSNESEDDEKTHYKKEVEQEKNYEALAEEAHKPNKKNQNEKSEEALDKDTKSDYKLKDYNKKSENDGSSALTYIGAAAGIGLTGLASLISALFNKKPREIERPNLQLVSNKAINEPQKSNYQTIDSVVAPPVIDEAVFIPEVKNGQESVPKDKTLDSVVIPTANNGKITQNQNLFFNPISNKLLENLIREAENRGAKVYFYAFNAADGSSYGYNAKESISSLSLNKVAINYVLVSMLQQGLLDMNKEVPYVPQLILDKEAKKEEFKIFDPDGAKSYKLEDLICLTLRLSGNSSANLELYALGSNGTYKENPTNDEIREQIMRGMQIVNNYMEMIGFSEIKIISPYLNKEKLEAIGIRDTDHTKNKITPEENSKFLAFIKQGGNLNPQYYKMLTNLMAGEQTAEHYWNILGGVDLGKPGLDQFNNGLAFVKGDVVGTLMLKHTNPLCEDDIVKSEMYIKSTDYGKEIMDYMAKYCTALHNLMHPSMPKAYNQIKWHIKK